jgi:hypothetical protein
MYLENMGNSPAVFVSDKILDNLNLEKLDFLITNQPLFEFPK